MARLTLDISMSTLTWRGSPTRTRVKRCASAGERRWSGSLRRLPDTDRTLSWPERNDPSAAPGLTVIDDLVVGELRWPRCRPAVAHRISGLLDVGILRCLLGSFLALP
jgi:hypothetical protein